MKLIITMLLIGLLGCQTVSTKVMVDEPIEVVADTTKFEPDYKTMVELTITWAYLVYAISELGKVEYVRPQRQ